MYVSQKGAVRPTALHYLMTLKTPGEHIFVLVNQFKLLSFSTLYKSMKEKKKTKILPEQVSLRCFVMFTFSVLIALNTE